MMAEFLPWLSSSISSDEHEDMLKCLCKIVPEEKLLQKSLETCQLKDVVARKPEKLDALVVDSGDNWSVGQRQLLCLGRVMLKRSRILFMDEATASVDSQTDGVFKRSSEKTSQSAQSLALLTEYQLSWIATEF